ncbi:MAG: hypothetical protein ABI664_18345 [bacterium]
MRELRAARDLEGVQPFMLELQIQPVIFLEDSWLEVIADDRADQYSQGKAFLSPVSGINVPDGLTAYRLDGGTERDPSYSFINISGSFELSDVGQEMAIGVWCENDLWRSRAFDGEPNGRHADASAWLLVECFRRIAQVSGGDLSVSEHRINPRR